VPSFFIAKKEWPATRGMLPALYDFSHCSYGGNNNIILPDPGKRQAAELEGPAA
jgi:hypothetical protein